MHEIQYKIGQQFFDFQLALMTLIQNLPLFFRCKYRLKLYHTITLFVIL